jgi:hypothetical protein
VTVATRQPIEPSVLRRLYRHVVSPPFARRVEPISVRHARNIAVLFLLAGSLYKFAKFPIETAFFDAASLPRWMMPLVGSGELTISLLLMSRATSTIGAIVGVALMTGALASVIASGWWILIGLPPITCALLIYVGWARRADMVAWLGVSHTDLS